MARRSQRAGGWRALDDGEASVVGEVDLDPSGSRRPARPTTFTGSDDHRVRPRLKTHRELLLAAKHADQSQKLVPVRHGTEGGGPGQNLGIYEWATKVTTLRRIRYSRAIRRGA